MSIVPYSPLHGMGKIQKLPYSYWEELKLIQTDYDMVIFCQRHWDDIKYYLSSTDFNNILKKNRINPGSFKYIYGILSSAILRAGGSRTMNWLYYTTNSAQVDDIVVETVNANRENLLLSLPDSERDFELSDTYLTLSEAFSNKIRNAAVNINNIILQNYKYILQLYNKSDDYNELFKKLIDISNNKNRNIINDTHELSKLVTKIDFALEKVGDNVVPIFIDANDLHGGIQWINDFNFLYKQLINDKSIFDNNESIVQCFVDTYLSAFYKIKGSYPKKILICLGDEKRWNQDGGYNYKSIKEAFKATLKNLNRDCMVEITYMKYYIDSLLEYNKNGKLRVRILNQHGQLSDDYFEDYELVIREYAKLLINCEKEEICFTEQVLTNINQKKFLILEDEKLRLLFDKRFILKILEKEKKDKFENLCIIPQNLGTYSLRENSAEKICLEIITNALNKGINEIVLKFVDKSRFIDTTAYFFNLYNQKHHELLFYTVMKLKKNLRDIDFITVESMLGNSFYNDRKVELRFLVFNKTFND